MQRETGDYLTSRLDDIGDGLAGQRASDAVNRVEVVVELDADVAAKVKALGPDWQERINEILKAAKL